MTNTTLAALAAHLAQRPPGRHLVAIVGAPGSGKSTQATALAQLIGPRAQVVPMDGFHFDDAVLEARGHRPRKGAPHTFDVDGLRSLLTRLRAGDADVAIPLFDRSLELARAGAEIVPTSCDLILVEGNYLLLNAAPWTTLHPLFHESVYLEVPESILRRRLTERWEGFGLNPDALSAKLEENDLPNARQVISDSIAADWTVQNT